MNIRILKQFPTLLVIAGIIFLGLIVCKRNQDFATRKIQLGAILTKLGEGAANIMIDCEADPPPPGCPDDTTAIKNYNKNNYSISLIYETNPEKTYSLFTIGATRSKSEQIQQARGNLCTCLSGFGDTIAQSMIDCEADPPPPGCPDDTTKMIESKLIIDIPEYNLDDSHRLKLTFSRDSSSVEFKIEVTFVDVIREQ